MTPVTSAPTKSEYVIRNADGTTSTVKIAELGMVLQFEVTVKDVERPTFTGGFNDRRKCAAEEVGVDEHEQCGGKRITYTTAPNDPLTLYYTGVEDVSVNCCGENYQCLPYQPYVDICTYVAP